MTRSTPRASVLADLIATAGAAVLGFAVLVYLPVGLLAAAIQDGWTAELLEGLGQSLPVPVRVFRGLQAWAPRLVLLLVAAASAWALLRRGWANLRGEFWTSFRSTVLLASILALATTVLGGGAALLAGSRLSEIALAAAGGGALVGLSLVILDLLTRLLRSRRGLAVVMVLVAGVLGVRWAADVWGRARLAAYDRGWEKEVAAERERMVAARRPVLRGTVRDDNAAAVERAALDAVKGSIRTGEEATALRAAQAGPYAPLAPDAIRLLYAHRAELDSLRSASAYLKCDWGNRYLASDWKSLPGMSSMRFAANALVVEGHRRAQAGDLRGAVETYLDVARFGGDLSEYGPLWPALVGRHVQEAGVQAMSQLLVGDRPGARAPLDDIARGLSALEGDFAPSAAALRGDRLMALGRFEERLSTSPSDAGLQAPLILPLVVPYQAVAAHTVLVADPLRRELERAFVAEDLDQWTRAGAAATARGNGTWNPILRQLMGGSSRLGGDEGFMPRLRLEAERRRARVRLLQAAIAVEAAREQTDRYPHELSPGALPVDPLAPTARLRYAGSADRSGYRLWSVGLDRSDDGGRGEKEQDLVLERVGRPGAGRAEGTKPGGRPVS